MMLNKIAHDEMILEIKKDFFPLHVQDQIHKLYSRGAEFNQTEEGKKHAHDEMMIEIKNDIILVHMKDQKDESFSRSVEFNQTVEYRMDHQLACLNFLGESLLQQCKEMKEKKRKQRNVVDKSDWTMDLLNKWEISNGVREELYNDASADARNLIRRPKTHSKCPCFDETIQRSKFT